MKIEEEIIAERELDDIAKTLKWAGMASWAITLGIVVLAWYCIFKLC